LTIDATSNVRPLELIIFKYQGFSSASTQPVMEAVEKQRQILTRKRSLIVKWLDPDDIVDDLIQSSLVGPSAAQQLQLNKTLQEKNRIIVDQLSIGGPGTLTQFCEILRSRKRQMYIAEELETAECHGKYQRPRLS